MSSHTFVFFQNMKRYMRDGGSDRREVCIKKVTMLYTGQREYV